MTSLERSDSLDAAIGRLSELFHGLRGMVGSLEEVVSQEVPLGELREIARDFGDDSAGFVDHLQTAIDRAEATSAGQQEDGVALRTYFKAKGLQWHTVILTTCNEGLIPHGRAKVEDERRLFYVGMTRASSRLVISWLGSVAGTTVGRSQFIDEAGLVATPSAGQAEVRRVDQTATPSAACVGRGSVHDLR